ncbi:hypothetical protein LNV08_21955 [Paucibacter sp. TC2R-5]|uniref:BPSL0761 family protein n=1 Tax=Paucibacter sp. TC2R-5 TaxID=2893555 RepID=UPI0021E3EAC0|nr:BPSL0761 family protein [Paucibacter sp. TC2R-5]MCV2361638.1 hypothetical protein [Paucibacter sp. TC2R-5]
MSTPSERMRALRWGGELLRAMTLEETLGFEIRQRAAQLIPDYPTPLDLIHLVETDAPLIHLRWAASIDAAGSLFDVLGAIHLEDETLIRKLMCTRRHYPELWLRQTWCEPNPIFSIRYWLLPEDDVGISWVDKV